MISLANTYVLPIVAVASVLGVQDVHSQPPPDNKGGSLRYEKACQPLDVEKKLRSREHALLGEAHAADHAKMRVRHCEVEQGKHEVPGKNKAVDARLSLQQDNDVKNAIIGRSSRPLKQAINFQTAALAAPAAPEATVGRWSAPFVIPVIGINAVLLHTGKVLFWSYDPAHYYDAANSNTGVAYVWDPATRTGHPVATPENLFCSGQTILSDGRVYIAGGNLRFPDPYDPFGKYGYQGSLTNYTFNPYAETFTRQPDMVRGRWYPTATQFTDNSILITSGTDETGTDKLSDIVEQFTPSPDIDGVGKLNVVSLHMPTGYYPHQFLMPDGKVLQAGPGAESSAQINPSNWNWSNLPRLSSDHYKYSNGITFTDTAVSPALQTIMIAGGTQGGVSVANNEWLDGMNPLRGWYRFPQWQLPRHNGNTVILPNGNLFTVGGNRGADLYDDSLLQAEMYVQQPTNVTGTWQTMAAPMIQSSYHSSALLLPDATVLLSEDDMDHSAGAAAQHKAQVYFPPYLFKGPQPVIYYAPKNLIWGQTFELVTDRNDMVSVILISPAAVTHGNDMHQRAIKLPIKPRAAGGVYAAVPPSSALVPPGYYMLFVLDSKGVPSVASYVKVG